MKTSREDLSVSFSLSDFIKSRKQGFYTGRNQPVDPHFEVYFCKLFLPDVRILDGHVFRVTIRKS